MSNPARTKPTDKDQHAGFVKAARDIGADESEEAFDKMLRKVASAPPPDTIKQRKADIERRKKTVQDSRNVAASARKKPKR